MGRILWNRRTSLGGNNVMTERETRIYEITMKPEQLNVLEAFFRTMTMLGKIGASRKLVVYMDGDGAVHPSIKKDGEEIPKEAYNEDFGDGRISDECEFYVHNGENYVYKSDFEIYYDLG